MEWFNVMSEDASMNKRDQYLLETGLSQEDILLRYTITAVFATILCSARLAVAISTSSTIPYIKKETIIPKALPTNFVSITNSARKALTEIASNAYIAMLITETIIGPNGVINKMLGYLDLPNPQTSELKIDYDALQGLAERCAKAPESGLQKLREWNELVGVISKEFSDSSGGDGIVRSFVRWIASRITSGFWYRFTRRSPDKRIKSEEDVRPPTAGLPGQSAADRHDIVREKYKAKIEFLRGRTARKKNRSRLSLAEVVQMLQDSLDDQANMSQGFQDLWDTFAALSTVVSNTGAYLDAIDDKELNKQQNIKLIADIKCLHRLYTAMLTRMRIYVEVSDDYIMPMLGDVDQLRIVRGGSEIDRICQEIAERCDAAQRDIQSTGAGRGDSLNQS